MERVFKDAIKYFGEQQQLIKTSEECSELIKACLKNDIENIIEEVADVTIMVEQLRLMSFWNEDKFQKILRYKINRLNSRIKERN